MAYKHTQDKRKKSAEWARRQYQNNTEFKEKCKEYARNYRLSGKYMSCLLNNPVRHEKQKQKQRGYRQSNKEVYQNYELNLTGSLNNLYIKRQLRKDGIPTEMSNKYPEIIEAKRLILKIKRFNYDTN